MGEEEAWRGVACIPQVLAWLGAGTKSLRTDSPTTSPTGTFGQYERACAGGGVQVWYAAVCPSGLDAGFRNFGVPVSQSVDNNNNADQVLLVKPAHTAGNMRQSASRTKCVSLYSIR